MNKFLDYCMLQKSVEEKIKNLRSFSFDKINKISDNNNKIDNIRLNKINL